MAATLLLRMLSGDLHIIQPCGINLFFFRETIPPPPPPPPPCSMEMPASSAAPKKRPFLSLFFLVTRPPPFLSLPSLLLAKFSGGPPYCGRSFRGPLLVSAPHGVPYAVGGFPPGPLPRFYGRPVKFYMHAIFWCSHLDGETSLRHPTVSSAASSQRSPGLLLFATSQWVASPECPRSSISALAILRMGNLPHDVRIDPLLLAHVRNQAVEFLLFSLRQPTAGLPKADRRGQISTPWPTAQRLGAVELRAPFKLSPSRSSFGRTSRMTVFVRR